MSYWDDLERHLNEPRIWMAHRLCRARINLRVSGDEDVWPLTWLRDQLAGRLPLGNAVSIGCGVGNLERDLVDQGFVHRITGVDLSLSCIDKASALRDSAGQTGHITYCCGDGLDWLRQATGLDAVFFHGSLHHIEHLEAVLDAAEAALSPSGILYLDEYIGPSRHQWRPHHLLLHNAVHRLLPRSVRRVGIIRAPINHDDPTEGIRSAEIPGAVQERFDVVARRDYGGNLLWIVYPNLRLPTKDDATQVEVLDESVKWLLDIEDWLATWRFLRLRPHYTVIVARKKASPHSSDA